jgi:acyl-CoA synthetase (AMP-forming)/AMP-acid ligase II
VKRRSRAEELWPRVGDDAVDQTATAQSRGFRDSMPEGEATGFRTRAWKRRSPEEPLVPHAPTMVDALVKAGTASARAGGERLRFTFLPENEEAPPELLSFASLSREARSMAVRLERLGVQRGDRVLLVLPTGSDFVVAFFAIQMARAIPVPAYPPAMLERAEVALSRLAHIARDSAPVLCLTDDKLAALIGGLALEARSIRRIDTVRSLRGISQERKKAVEIDPDDIAFLQYTSGSTGDPKGVVVSHRAAMANCHAMGVAGKITRKDVVVSWLPLYHDMGLVSSVLWAMYWRLPSVLLAPQTFLMDPVRWLRALSDHHGTVSCAPSFAYARCVKRVDAEERARLDLSSWRIALNGAEPVSARVMRDFVRAFGPSGFREETFFPSYGLAENVVAATFAAPERPPRVHRLSRAALAAGQARDVGPDADPADVVEVVSCGRALPGHQVLVVDEHGVPLPEREVGHVVVRGPSHMDGYWQKPARTKEILARGALWTGDLAALIEGELFLVGRVKDLIIVRGKNHYAADIEDAAEEVRGVRAGGACAFALHDEAEGSDLCVVVVESAAQRKGRGSAGGAGRGAGDEDTRHNGGKTLAEAARDDGEQALIEAVLGAVQERCGLRPEEVVVVKPQTIPRTSSGKKQRLACRDLYLEGALTPRRTSKLKAALLVARSGVGHLVTKARSATRPASPPPRGSGGT